MQKSIFVALLAVFVSLASAQAGEIVVTCGELPFGDLKKLEIQETDLKGQYLIVETLYDYATRREKTRLSPVFGSTELEKGEFPELTPWNGYTRTLVRYGRDRYAIEIRDECGGAISSISCKDRF